MVVDEVYTLLKDKPLSFKELFTVLKEKQLVNENQMGELFSDLTFDTRFVYLDDLWDLSSRHTYAEKVVKVTFEDEDLEKEKDYEVHVKPITLEEAETPEDEDFYLEEN